MTIYTDYIGSGTGASYATLAFWYDASGDGDVTYTNGDEVRAVFQSSGTEAPEGNHNGPHVINDDQTSPICWTEDKDITITLSSTNLAGSGPPNGNLSLATGSLKFHNASSVKTWNFNNLDMDFAGGKIEINKGLDALASSPLTPVNFTNCRMVGPSAAPISNRIIEVGATTADVSGVTNFTFTNCIIKPNARFVLQEAGTGNSTNSVICNVIGCSLHNAASPNSWFYPNNNSNSKYEVHISGTLANFAGGTPDAFNGVVRSGAAGYTSGTATDYISNEREEIITGWANTKTNVSSEATFVYGVAPGANEVGFSGPLFGDNPFDLMGSSMDLRLWESTNNIASGYVSNVTLPSPDLAGHSRGTSPFDAGPYEISFISGGGGGGSNENLSLVLVSVNLYN